MRQGAIRYLGLTAVAMAVIALAEHRTAIAQAPTATEPVTFSRDVLPILQQHCQTCHRPGQIGPMSLLDYQEARPWSRAIKAKVISREMPPWMPTAPMAIS